MIRRVSMWKLKNTNKAEEMKTIPLSMKGKVLSLFDIEVEINISSHQKAYDILFLGTFKNNAALIEFDTDNFHQDVANWLI